MPAEHVTAGLHYLTEGDDPRLTPLVYVPGALGTAEDFTREMERLLPRRTASVSLRGRGESRLPAAGFRLEDHAADLEAILEDLGWERLVLMAYSMGVPVAVRAAARRDDLAGLILLDYPARWPETSERWVEEALRSKPEQEPLIRRLHEASEVVELWEDLGEIRCPVLVVHGGQPDSALLPEDAERYRTALERVRMIELPEAGHRLWEPDYDRFLGVVEDFLGSLD